MPDRPSAVPHGPYAAPYNNGLSLAPTTSSMCSIVHHPFPSSSSASFRSLFDAVLAEYAKKTGTDLASHPLTSRLGNCDSIDDVVLVLQEQLGALNERKSDRSVRLMERLAPTIGIGLELSKVLGDGIGLAFPPATFIFSSIGILLATVIKNYDALVELFDNVGNFLERLKIYTRISIPDALMGVVVKTLAEVLLILGLAKKQIDEGLLKKCGKMLLGGSGDVRDALQRLDRLTKEEAQMTVAQILDVIHGLVNNMKVVMEDREISTEAVQHTLRIMQQTASDISKTKRDRLLSDCHAWWFYPNPSTNHNIARKAHLPGTAEWRIQGEVFVNWKAGVLCYGSMASRDPEKVLSDLSHSYVQLGLASMAYFYCDFRDSAKQHLRGLLCSLLIQFCAQSDSYHDILSRLYSKYASDLREPSEVELVKHLKEMLGVPDQGAKFIILDALDECPDSGMSSPREEALGFLKDLLGVGYSGLRICVTSRPEEDIWSELDPLVSHRVALDRESGQRQDVVDYIRWAVNSDRKMRKWNAEDKELVIDTLSRNANGIVREIAEVLAVDFNHKTPVLNVKRRPDDPEQAILSTCPGSFITTVPGPRGTRIVQFAHFSVQEFLTSDRLLRVQSQTISRYFVLSEPAHTVLAQVCLGVLLQLGDRIKGDIYQDFPLAYYAVWNWMRHARFMDASQHLKDAIECLFDGGKPHFAAWVQLYDADSTLPYGRNSVHPLRPDQTPLYYAVICGLNDLVVHLIGSHPQDICVRGGAYSTVLHAASAHGYHTIAKLLLDHGVPVDARDFQDTTAFQVASARGMLGSLGYCSTTAQTSTQAAVITARR
ncbi:hypothetical protein BC834DRAFT_1045986 [Gloeopeniophorella convolvens]|nr:hypothetical protein BC834DRAFT_1045986 [Gloeopeniophorella convolvens]